MARPRMDRRSTISTREPAAERNSAIDMAGSPNRILEQLKRGREPLEQVLDQRARAVGEFQRTLARTKS
jgi:hypothetical protein